VTSVSSPERRLRVEALLSGRLAASSRFRVLQHVDPLRALGVDVRAVPPRISKYASLPARYRRHRLVARPLDLGLRGAKLAVRLPGVARSRRADLTWLEREMLPQSLTLEPLLGQPLLFDVDDAIWLLSPGHERAARHIARRSSCVVAGNDFIADWFSTLGSEVERVWTAVDTDRFLPLDPSGPFVVGWTGSGSTLRYLEALADPLARFLEAAPDARLLVMADVAPVLADLPSDRVDFVSWSPDLEAPTVGRISAGIMPLPDTDWGRGKCAFKMLQYLSCAVPAVVSPVGMATQVLNMAEVGFAARDDGDWVEALLALYRDRELGRRLGRHGRALAKRSFSRTVISTQLASCMRRHSAQPTPGAPMGVTGHRGDL
jgi:glycosyltransferase involved in cell wall biosynthesis